MKLVVFFTILFACFIFRTEKFNLIKLLGCILGFSGVVLINLGGDFSFTFSIIGEGFLIFSGLSAATASGFVKIFSKHENTTALCGYQFLIGGVVLIIIGLSFGGSINQISVGAVFLLLYLAFLSACAYRYVLCTKNDMRTMQILLILLYHTFYRISRKIRKKLI